METAQLPSDYPIAMSIIFGTTCYFPPEFMETARPARSLSRLEACGVISGTPFCRCGPASQNGRCLSYAPRYDII
ncbi:MAG: hypothetical protein AB2L14_10005 [Candidatus Xenobiia bacterium LiM19]